MYPLHWQNSESAYTIIHATRTQTGKSLKRCHGHGVLPINALPAWCNVNKGDIGKFLLLEKRIFKMFDFSSHLNFVDFCNSITKRLAIKALNAVLQARKQNVRLRQVTV